MNALSPTVHAVAKIVLGESLRDEGARRLAGAVRVYGNGCSSDEEAAIAAYVEGRPSFWSTAGYHSQRALCLLSSANAGRSIEEALRFCYSGIWARDHEAALGTLVPLNHLAAMNLATAYAARGIWREVEELEARRLGRVA